MPQPHKGERVYAPTRLHPDLARLLRAEARNHLIPVGDLIATYVAEHYERSDLAPVARARTAEAPVLDTLEEFCA